MNDVDAEGNWEGHSILNWLAKILAAIALAAAAYALVAAVQHYGVPSRLNCLNAETDINRALANGPLAKIVKWSVVTLDAPAEISRTDTTLRCSATALLNDGQPHKVGYTFTRMTDDGSSYYISVEELGAAK
jgi:hypothetical protein